MDANGPAIELFQLTRMYGKVPALIRASVRIERGEAVVVSGPNGAGKSTLLNVITTLASPTFGSGQVVGFDLVRDRMAVRERVELLGHQTRLYDDLSALENLHFVCRLHGVEPARAMWAVEQVGLMDVVTEPVRAFSKGMRQRVALARALMREPEVLLLDEPYVGLDDDAKGLVDAMVRTTLHAGRTVVAATHDDGRCRWTSRTVHMENGRIAAGPGNGRADEVKHDGVSA
ncbi:heme ABC exporter ATP-binding protein CcmA [Actinomadura sp. ATCC 39365]